MTTKPKKNKTPIEQVLFGPSPHPTSRPTNQSVEEFYAKFGSRLPCMTSGTRARVENWLNETLSQAKRETEYEMEQKFRQILRDKGHADLADDLGDYLY